LKTSFLRERCHKVLPGQYFDKETGLHYNYQRDAYDAAMGRFTQPEPLGLFGDINLYRYARNNPLTYIDPDGRQAIPMPPRPAPPGGAPGSMPGGKKPVPVFPEGFDPNPKSPQGTPTIEVPGPPPSGGPSQGGPRFCDKLFDLCMKGAQACGPFQPVSTAACFAGLIACRAIYEFGRFGDGGM